MDNHYEFVVDMSTGKVLDSMDLRFVRMPWSEAEKFAALLEDRGTALTYALEHGHVVKVDPTPSFHFIVNAESFRAHVEGMMLPEPVTQRLVGLTDDEIDAVLMDEVDYDRLVEQLSDEYDDTADKLFESVGVESGVCVHCHNWIWTLDGGKTWVDWNNDVECEIDGVTHVTGPSES